MKQLPLAECDHCEGTGIYKRDKCWICDGEGKVWDAAAGTREPNEME